MNKFFWRITICVAPLLISAWIVGNAFYNYLHGKGGFKLGVDLAGGTILIYEVDVDKFPDQKLPADWNPQEPGPPAQVAHRPGRHLQHHHPRGQQHALRDHPAHRRQAPDRRPRESLACP